MNRFLRNSALGLALIALTGCQQLMPGTQDTGPDRARLAAEAARAEYPQDAEVTDGPAVAVVNRADETIRIYNLSEQGISDAYVWVNGSYVSRVGSIPAHGSVELNHNRFFGPQGRTLAEQRANVNRVEIQVNDQLYRVQGPAFD